MSKGQKGRTGFKYCAVNGMTGACQTTPSLASVAARATRVNATSGTPIVDASLNCLVANSRRWVWVAVAKPEPPQQTGPCGRTHATPFLLSLTTKFEHLVPLHPPPQLNFGYHHVWLLLLLLLQAHERRGWTFDAPCWPLNCTWPPAGDTSRRTLSRTHLTFWHALDGKSPVTPGPTTSTPNAVMKMVLSANATSGPRTVNVFHGYGADSKALCARPPGTLCLRNSLTWTLILYL